MKVLIIDDEKNIRESLKKYLKLEKIDSALVENAEKALELLEIESFDAMIVDLKLPGMSGLEALQAIRQRGILTPVIMISAHGQIEDAVTALKAGAGDYLVKPFDPAELIIRLKSLTENRRRDNLIETNTRFTVKSKLIGETSVMRHLSEQLSKIAATDVTVLICGESGTGKEVAAREIHDLGPNAAEPFAAINIGGIHEGLMESELFGHEKGSYTGALARKQGLFELAGRGTIFLDEIGEMPQTLQVKLLRVLQEKKIKRLGGTYDIPYNARIISATNQNIEKLIKDGRFREDLFYRLNVFRITIPPLRERKEDIKLLAVYLADKLSKRMGRPCPVISGEVWDKLMQYSFPGNVRELENILERALIYCSDNQITKDDIDLHPVKTNPENSSSALSLDEVEKKAFLDALALCNGNRTKAAEMLGVTRKTIINKLRSWNL